MSDQFGGYAPPPPATPAIPPPPPAPGYGQTPYVAPAQPPYQQPYGQPAYGQPSPPPKSGAGLKIVLGIVGGIVVILGVLMVIGAVAGGSDKKKTTTLADSTATTAATTATTAGPLPPTTVRPAPTTAAPATKPAGDSVEISRTGAHAFSYTVGLPTGWDQADIKGQEPELQLTRTTSGATTGVILVHNLTAETGQSITSLQEAIDATKQGVEQEVTDAQIVGSEEHGDMGGEDAAVFAFTAKNDRGDKLAGEVVVAVHNGNAFNVVFEATPDAFQTHLDDFTKFLDSWNWKS